MFYFFKLLYLIYLGYRVNSRFNCIVIRLLDNKMRTGCQQVRLDGQVLAANRSLDGQVFIRKLMNNLLHSRGNQVADRAPNCWKCCYKKGYCCIGCGCVVLAGL